MLATVHQPVLYLQRYFSDRIVFPSPGATSDGFNRHSLYLRAPATALRPVFIGPKWVGTTRREDTVRSPKYCFKKTTFLRIIALRISIGILIYQRNKPIRLIYYLQFVKKALFIIHLQSTTAVSKPIVLWPRLIRLISCLHHRLLWDTIYERISIAWLSA
jgi:hypothetical protein